MYFLYTIIASLVSFFILRWLKKRRYCTDLKRLDGKTVLVTGKQPLLLQMSLIAGSVCSIAVVKVSLGWDDMHDMKLCSVQLLHSIWMWSDNCMDDYWCFLNKQSLMSTVGYIYVQVGILVSARTRLLPWQWEVPVSSLLAETRRRPGRLWGRSSLRVTVLTSITWSWTWPTCSLWESSARTSSKERRDSTSWSTMQVTTKDRADDFKGIKLPSRRSVLRQSIK